MSPNSQVKASLLCFIPMSYMPGLIVCALDFASSASASKPDRGNCFCVPGQNTRLAQCHSLIESVSGYHWTVKQPDRLLGSGLRWTSNTSGLALHDTEIGASKHRKQWVMQSSLQVLTYSTRQAHVFLLRRITILSIPKIKTLFLTARAAVTQVARIHDLFDIYTVCDQQVIVNLVEIGNPRKTNKQSNKQNKQTNKQNKQTNKHRKLGK